MNPDLLCSYKISNGKVVRANNPMIIWLKFNAKRTTRSTCRERIVQERWNKWCPEGQCLCIEFFLFVWFLVSSVRLFWFIQ